MRKPAKPPILKLFLNHPQQLWITLWVTPDYPLAEPVFMRLSTKCYIKLQMLISNKINHLCRSKKNKTVFHVKFHLLDYVITVLCISDSQNQIRLVRLIGACSACSSYALHPP